MIGRRERWEGEGRGREREEGVEENVRGTHVYILIPMEGM